jgi:hypothetical protein
MASGAIGWTCARCDVNVRWMPGFESRGLPMGWSGKHEVVFCLSCRRALAGETGVVASGEPPTAGNRARACRDATVEFEIGRDGDRPDQVIARACGTSPAVVARLRRRRH